MKRADAISAMQFAGYHGDRASYTRLLIENRVGRGAANAAWTAGSSARRSGMRCGCTECREPTA